MPAQFLVDTSDRARAAGRYERLVTSVLLNYEGAIVAVTDSQAPYWYTSLALQCELGMIEDAERIAGLVFHSVVKHRCNLVRGDATSVQILEYVLALDSLDFSQVTEAIERPNETLTVLLRIAQKLGLSEVFDEDLWRLDGTSFMAYVCDKYENFGARYVEVGSTSNWQIGYDIFRVDELSATWPKIHMPASDLQSVLVVLSSLLLPDRVAWHVLR